MKRFIIFACVAVVGVLTACEKEQPFVSQLQEVFPPVPITNAALFRMNYLPVTPPFFQGYWTLVSLGNKDCDLNCKERLDAISGLDDVQKLYFAEGLANHNQLNDLAVKYADVAITTGTTAFSVENFSRQFDVDFIGPEAKKNFIYLINPQAELEFALAPEAIHPGILQQEINGLMARD